MTLIASTYKILAKSCIILILTHSPIQIKIYFLSYVLSILIQDFSLSNKYGISIQQKARTFWYLRRPDLTAQQRSLLLIGEGISLWCKSYLLKNSIFQFCISFVYTISIHISLLCLSLISLRLSFFSLSLSYNGSP